MRANILVSGLLLLIALPSYADTTYVIRQGDTLLKIADRTLGTVNDPRRYDFAKGIRAKNPQLTNPNELNPGDTLTLPDVAGKAAPKAAPKAASVARVQPRVQPNVAVAPAPSPETEALPTPAPSKSEDIPVAILPAPTPAPRPAPTPMSTPVAALPMPPPLATPARVSATPSAAPVHTEQVHADYGTDRDDYLEFQPRYQFVKVRAKDLATDRESEIISKESVGLDLTYAKAWGDKTHFLVTIGATYNDFGSFEPDTSTLDQAILWQKNFGLGIAVELTHSLHIDIMATLADHTFFVPMTPSTFTAQSILMPGAEVTLSWDFIRARSFSVGASVIGEYSARVEKQPVTYESSLDPKYVLYWNSERGFDKVNYKASITYEKNGQKTTYSEQEETNWIAGVALQFPL